MVVMPTMVNNYLFKNKHNNYNTQENFGGGNFWQIITDEAIGEENFGESADSLGLGNITILS